MSNENLPEENANATKDRILSELFVGAAVGFDPTTYDVQNIVDGRVVFGWKSAGQFDPSNLLHEMAHFVEINEKRMAKEGYGFRYPKALYSGGRYSSVYYEPKTMRMTAREIRTMAYQHHLHEHFGIPTLRELDRIYGILSFMPDIWQIPGHSDGARKNWILSVYDRLVKSPRYCYASFLAEWNRRNRILKGRR